jgi:drug/metabolite transporter (DMT)-like permease
MRRPRRIELMLLAVVVLWALNLTVTRYILTHGFEPLPYATIRYGLAALVFLGITAVAERSLRVVRSDWWLVAAATISLWLNQLAFVFALDSTSASTIGLVLGATPIFAALLGLALGTEQLHGRFWLGAAVSFAGVALVALGAGGEIEGGPEGVALGVLTAATWAAYSVAIAPLMSRYSPYRISALVLSLGWVLIAVTGAPATAGQELELGWEVWALLVFATLGPLVATNVLWFRSLDRIGPARATLAANLQPFVAVVFALVLLSEPLTPLQVAGGVLIGGGIVLARRRRRVRRLAAAVSSRPWRGTESVQATTDEGGRRRWMRGSGS